MLTALLLAPVVIVLAVCVVVYIRATDADACRYAGELPRHKGTHRRPTSTTRVMAQAALYTVLIVA